MFDRIDNRVAGWLASPIRWLCRVMNVSNFTLARLAFVAALVFAECSFALAVTTAGAELPTWDVYREGFVVGLWLLFGWWYRGVLRRLERGFEQGSSVLPLAPFVRQFIVWTRVNGCVLYPVVFLPLARNLDEVLDLATNLLAGFSLYAATTYHRKGPSRMKRAVRWVTEQIGRVRMPGLRPRPAWSHPALRLPRSPCAASSG